MNQGPSASWSAHIAALRRRIVKRAGDGLLVDFDRIVAGLVKAGLP
jgi:hypothetical protein